MLAVPLKTTSSIDFYPIVKQHIDSTYSISPEKTRQHDDYFQSLTKMRQTMTAFTSKTFQLTDAELFRRYIQRLERIATRFDNLIDFSWSNSLIPREIFTSKAIVYEKTSWLYTLASLHTLLGACADHATTNGLQLSCRAFMVSAGIFDYLLQKIVPQLAVLKIPEKTDLSIDILEFLSLLMLAQAQECYYLKATKEKLKFSVQAKLARESINMYCSALHKAGAPMIKRQLNQQWIVQVTLHVMSMKSSFQYCQSKVCKEQAIEKGKGYGEEIARLRLSKKHCSDTLNYAKENRLPLILTQYISELSIKINETLQMSEEENQSIYMERIPEEADLQDVKGVSMAKPIILDWLQNAITEDEPDSVMLKENIFDCLVPKIVTEKCNVLIDSFKNKYCNIQKEVVDFDQATDTEIKTILIAVGSKMIPEELWMEIRDTQEKNMKHIVKEWRDGNEKRYHTLRSNLINARQQLGDMEGKEKQDSSSKEYYDKIDLVLKELDKMNDAERQFISRSLQDQNLTDITLLSRSEIENASPIAIKQETMKENDEKETDRRFKELVDRSVSFLRDKEKQRQEILCDMYNTFILKSISPLPNTEKEMHEMMKRKEDQFADIEKAIRASLDECKEAFTSLQQEKNRYIDNNDIIKKQDVYCKRYKEACERCREETHAVALLREDYNEIVNKVKEALQAVQDYIIAREYDRKQRSLNEKFASMVVQFEQQYEPPKSSSSPLFPDKIEQPAARGYPNRSEIYPPAGLDHGGTQVGIQLGTAAANPSTTGNNNIGYSMNYGMPQQIPYVSTISPQQQIYPGMQNLVQNGSMAPPQYFAPNAPYSERQYPPCAGYDIYGNNTYLQQNNQGQRSDSSCPGYYPPPPTSFQYNYKPNDKNQNGNV